MCACSMSVNSWAGWDKLWSYVRLFVAIASAREIDLCESSVFSWAEREKLLSYVQLQGRVICVPVA